MARATDELGKVYKVSYHEKSPPFAAIAIAKLLKISIELYADPRAAPNTEPSLQLTHREKLTGKAAITRYLARIDRAQGFAGSSVLESVQVDHWIDYANLIVNGPGLEAVCASMNEYLSLRVFLSGHQLSAGDIACWAQLAGSLQWEGLKKGGSYPHLKRWYDFITSIPELQALTEEYYPKRNNAAKRKVAEAIKEAKANKETANQRHTDASFDIGLGPDWSGRVVTRFPPEPSGFLHIGHAKALILNQEIAAANKGRMLVRFDDTNPDKEKDIYVESILADSKRLGADIDKVTYTSNYFPEMLDLAERLIQAGHLYADDTPQEVMKEERLAKQASKRRDRSVEETLQIFKEMQAGSKAGMTNCLRFKIDPANDNGTLRDPVAYRCNLTPHLHTGTKYKAYPTYDFACPFVDAYEKVTHALRSSEYKDREEQFYRILKMQQQVWPGLPDVHVWDYSRLSFIHTVLSKRKLTKLVNEGIVDGWDDPRMPTVQGLLRRGLTVPALREFMLAQGASRNVTYQEWDKLWTFNKKNIDPVCPRHTAVEADRKVPLRLTDVQGTDYVTVDKHKKYPPAGKKTTMRSPELFLETQDAELLKEGEEVTLMDWGNAIIKVIERDDTGAITGLEGVTNLEGSVKTTKWKLTWLAKSEELIPLTLVDFDHILTKKKLEDEDEILDLINPCSRWETEALGDSNMRVLQKGDVIQLERKGYYIVDKPYLRPGKPMVLLNIPDGRQTPLRKPSSAADKAAVKPTKALNGVATPATPAQTQSTSSANASPAPASIKSKSQPAASGQSKAEKASQPAARGLSETPASTKIAVPLKAPPLEPASSHPPAQAAANSRDRVSTSTSGGAASAQIIEAVQQGRAQSGNMASPPAISQPIPVPGPSRTLEGMSPSVPPTPANTPQNSAPLSMTGQRPPPPDLSGAPLLPPHLTARIEQLDSVPPTPYNTPQRSLELPQAVRERMSTSPTRAFSSLTPKKSAGQ